MSSATQNAGERATASLLARQGVARALGGSLLSACLAQALLLVSGVIAARALGVEDRGRLALLALVPTILAQIGDLGVPTAITYYLATSRTATRSVWRISVHLATTQILALAPIHVAVAYLALDAGTSHAAWLVVIALLAVPALLLRQYGLGVLQGRRRYTAFNLLRVAPAGCYAMFLIILLILDRSSLLTITAAWVIANIIATVAIVGIAWETTTAEVRDEHADSRSLLRLGLQGLLGKVSPAETLHVDQAVVGLFMPPTALGLYAVGLAFTSLPRLLGHSVGLIAYPTVAAAARRDAYRSMWRFVAFSALVSGLSALVLAFSVSLLVPFFFGAEFSHAVGLAQVLLGGSFFFSVRRTVVDGARGLGHPGVGTIAEIGTWLWMVPGFIVLGRMLGSEGIALAHGSAGAVGLVVAIMAVINARGRRRERDFASRPTEDAT